MANTEISMTSGWAPNRDIANPHITDGSEIDTEIAALSAGEYVYWDRPGFLYVGVAGDVEMRLESDADVTLTLAQGIHPFKVKRVYGDNTTATGLHICW